MPLKQDQPKLARYEFMHGKGGDMEYLPFFCVDLSRFLLASSLSFVDLMVKPQKN